MLQTKGTEFITVCFVRCIMENKNKLAFSFGTKDKKKIKTYIDFLKKVHTAGKLIVEVDLSKNTIAKINFYDELQKNIRFLAKGDHKRIIGSFFGSFVSADDKLSAQLFINNDVADLFFNLPEKDFLFQPLRSKYAKLIYNKLGKNNEINEIITVSRDEIIYDWGIDTDAKMSQFILRLPLYIDEINGSGLLDGELSYSIARASEKKQSRMIAVLLRIKKDEKDGKAAKNKNKSHLKSPQSDDKAVGYIETPAPKQYTKEDEGTLLCPRCGGKVVRCEAKNGKVYECCERSPYNVNIPVPERGQCKGYYKQF